MVRAKLFLLLICMLFCQTHLAAQSSEKIISFGQKIKGIWQWSNCKDTFRTKLLYYDTLVRSKVNSDSFNLLIYGWHTYIENGKLVESSFNSEDSVKRYKTSITGTIMNEEKIMLIFHDITRDRDFRIILEFPDSSAKKLKWTSVFAFERPLYPPTKSKNREGQTVPSPIVLRKIAN